MSENAQAFLGLIYLLILAGGFTFVAIIFKLPQRFAQKQQEAQVRRMKTQVLKGQTDRILLNRAVKELHDDGEL